MKKYIAKTSVSVNIVLEGGANRHIAFTSLTGGGSVFYTDDPEVQKALERHYKFGKLFSLDKNFEAKKPAKQAPAPQPPTTSPTEQPNAEGETTDETPTPTDETPEPIDIVGEAPVNPELKTIVVTDPDSAKAYLAEHFGISRTKLTSIKKIKEAAEANGIVFQGI